MHPEPHTQSTEDVAADALERLVEAFEECWAAGGNASVDDFLPPTGHPDFHEILTELLRVDMERRGDVEAKACLRSYRDRYPDTFQQQTYRQALAFEAYRLLAVSQRIVSRQEFALPFDVDTAGWPEPSTLRAAEPAPPDALLKPGQELLGFTVLYELGRGAFSRVYLAQQLDLADRFVVLKASRELWDESDVLARLQHTNIMPIHSVHHWQDLQIVCMPYWGSATLADIIARHRRDGSGSTVTNRGGETVAEMSEGAEAAAGTIRVGGERVPSLTTGTFAHRQWCLDILEQVAAGVAHAHARGIVHRDLKPANILVADDGRPLVLDFNLARVASRPQANVGGTLPYMAPEQLEGLVDGEAEVAPTSDVFAMGVILFELLTDQLPFPLRSGMDDEALKRRVAERRRGMPELPRAADQGGLRAILQRCLAPLPEDRYQTAGELQADLAAEKVGAPLVHAREGWARRCRKYFRQYRRGLLLSAAVLFAVAAFIAIPIAMRKARENQGLRTRAELARFEQDQEWLSVVLHSPVADGKEQEAAGLRLAHWASWARSSAPELDPNEQTRLARQLRELESAWRELTAAGGVGDDAIPLPLSGAADTAGKSATQYLRESRQALREGRLAEALDRARDAQLAQPKSYAAWAQQGYVYRAQHLFADAEACFSVCVALRPDLSWSYLQRGIVRLESQRYALAVHDLEQALRLSPRDQAARFNQALAWKGLGESRRALTALGPLLQEEVTENRWWFLAADLCHALGDSRMEAYRQHGLEIPPPDQRNWLSRGMVRLREGEAQAALADFREASRLWAKSVPPRQNMAHVLAEHLGDNESAMRVLDDALKLAPHSSELLGSRAVLAARSGDAVSARAAIEQALAADPRPQTLVRAASVYALTESSVADTDRAVAYLKQAVQQELRWAGAAAVDPDLKALHGLAEFQALVRAGRTLEEQ